MKKLHHRIQSFVSKPAKGEITFHTFYFPFSDIMEFLEFLNDTVPPFYEKFFQKYFLERNSQVLALNEKDKKEFDRIVNLSKKKKFNKIKIKSVKVQQLLSKDAKYHIFTHNINYFLKEMGLVYLITKFEEFLRSELTLIYQKYPKMLSKKTIEYGEVLDAGTDVKKQVIEKQLNDTVSEDIDEINNYLKEKLNLDLTKNKKWHKFKERFYRRNVIIHNKGYPDKKYFEKTGKKKNTGRLLISDSYFKESLKLFREFSHQLTDYFEQKHGKKKYHKDRKTFFSFGIESH